MSKKKTTARPTGVLAEELERLAPITVPRYATPKPEMAPTLKPIPAGQAGDFSVIHRTLPAYAPLKFFRKEVSWPQPRKFTILQQGYNNVWMSDTPQETVAMAQAAEKMHGDVLATGLGLGVFQRCLPEAVTSCLTIEMQAEVVSLVWEHVQRKDLRQSLVVGDAKEALSGMFNQSDQRFDFVFLDTWDSGDYEQLPWVNWHVRAAQKLLKRGGRVHAWAQANMLRSFVNDALSLIESIGWQTDLKKDTEKRAGMHRRWPLMAKLMDWYWDEHKTPPDSKAIQAWCNFVGRRITADPGHMLKMTTAREVQAHLVESGSKEA